MNSKQTYNEIINHSIENHFVPVADHLIEECSEVIKELCNENRGRGNNTIPELADLLFQIDKYLKSVNCTREDLEELSIAKSCVKYPDFMETLS